MPRGEELCRVNLGCTAAYYVGDIQYAMNRVGRVALNNVSCCNSIVSR